VVELSKSVADFALFFLAFHSTFFGGRRFVPIFLGYFTINRPCIRVNLKIEGVENKGLEINKKTRVCIEFALGNKH